MKHWGHKMKKVTIKEIKRFLKTLEENRYRKLVHADARRIAWFVNNSISEDYDTMPETMRKKWVKAEYKKERYMAKKFLESMKQNESVRLDEAEIWFNPKEFEPFLKKIGLDFPKYPKQGDVLYKGKTVGYMSNFNGFMVYSKSLLKQLQKVEKKYKLGIWNPTSGLTMENKIRQIIRETIRDLMEAKRTQLQIPIIDKLKVDKILKKLKLKMGKDYDYGVGKGSTFILDVESKHLDKVVTLFMQNRIRVKGI